MLTCTIRNYNLFSTEEQEMLGMKQLEANAKSSSIEKTQKREENKKEQQGKTKKEKKGNIPE